MIDELDQENIVETPYEKIFLPKEEDLTERWNAIPELSSDSQKVWGCSSVHSILDDRYCPAGGEARLFFEGEEVASDLDDRSQPASWRWIRSEFTIDPRFDLDLGGANPPDVTMRGVLLAPNRSVDFERILPEGHVDIEIQIERQDLGLYAPRMTLLIDGSEQIDIELDERRAYRIRHECDLGNHTFELKNTSSEPDYKDKTRTGITLHQISLKTSSDLVLFSQDGSSDRKVGAGTFSLRYLTYASDSPRTGAEFTREEIGHLRGLIERYPNHDQGMGTNSYSLKKKIINEDYTFNALLAYPRTEYQYQIKVPNQAVFDLGYGFAKRIQNVSDRDELHFTVRVTYGKKTETILSRKISFKESRILFERLPLSDYSGRSITLSLITEQVTAIKINTHASFGIPVWVNPVIYPIENKNVMNVVLISIDTLRPDHLGCYGYPKETSPHIDKFAQEGVTFLNTMSTTNWTLPAHMSMLTSLDIARHQVYHNNQSLSTEIVTLADILRQNGYYCGGITGGGYLSERYGFSRGFDEYQELKAVQMNDSLRYDEAELQAGLADQWLTENSNKQFFLFLHTYQPHDPYANSSPYGKIFLDEVSKLNEVWMSSFLKSQPNGGRNIAEVDRQNIIDLYDGDIRYTDELFVQPVLDKLKELGLYDRTMIIITSDHGEEFFEHEGWTHNQNLYHEGIKIPLIIKFPESKHAGTKFAPIARITDIGPTILEQAGIDRRPFDFDGQSLFSLINGNDQEERRYFSELALGEFSVFPFRIAVNFENFKFILHRKLKSSYAEKICVDVEGNTVELYDVVRDPRETNNIADEPYYRQLCLRLINEINSYLENNKAKLDMKSINMDDDLEKRLRALGYIR